MSYAMGLATEAYIDGICYNTRPIGKSGFVRMIANLAGDKFVDSKKISEMEFPSPLSGVGK